MTSHELAKVLLANEDLPVELRVYGHSYSSLNHAFSHGPLQVRVGENNYGVRHISLTDSATGDRSNGELVYEAPRYDGTTLEGR